MLHKYFLTVNVHFEIVCSCFVLKESHFFTLVVQNVDILCVLLFLDDYVKHLSFSMMSFEYDTRCHSFYDHKYY